MYFFDYFIEVNRASYFYVPNQIAPGKKHDEKLQSFALLINIMSIEPNGQNTKNFLKETIFHIARVIVPVSIDKITEY